jgi:predicted thioesterase
MVKRIATFFLAATVCALCFEIGERFLSSGAHGVVTTVEAVVGRPLTPVSVSGVARRTSRRCAADVYDC